MKKNELKKVLKPLIKECIKECIFEEGVLSGIIKEVAQGMSGNIVSEAKRPPVDRADIERQEEELERTRQEKIRRLNETISFGEVNVFEGTKTIPAEASGQNALSGVSPDDSGVNIDGIVALASDKWKRLI
tara:strand:+ start:43237 stop:43629 length:393 start_codon:yes stop_codon:yes gene_type:complete